MTDRPDHDQDSQLLDPQLLEFARRFDPARRLPDAPPITAEQLRRRAERRELYRDLDRSWRSGPFSRQLRQVWLPAICVIGVVVLSVLGITSLRPPVGPDVAGSPPAQGSPSPTHPAGPARPAPLELPASQGDERTAKETLTGLAAIAAKQPPMTPAMFTYVRRQAWAVAGPSVADAVTEAVVATDIQTWLRGDLSAFEQSTKLPPQPGGSQTTQWTQQLPGEMRGALQTYGKGGYPHPITSPSEQAGILAGQIGNAYDYHVAAGVADLFRLGLTPAQRQAALQVLADIRNLAFHGTVKDRASRTGIAFTSTDPGTGVREVLIFNPTTGQLLDHERWLTGAGGVIEVDAYTLYLDIRTTNTRT
jgi:hypothetical protein